MVVRLLERFESALGGLWAIDETAGEPLTECGDYEGRSFWTFFGDR